MAEGEIYRIAAFSDDRRHRCVGHGRSHGVTGQPSEMDPTVADTTPGSPSTIRRAGHPSVQEPSSDRSPLSTTSSNPAAGFGGATSPRPGNRLSATSHSMKNGRPSASMRSSPARRQLRVTPSGRSLVIGSGCNPRRRPNSSMPSVRRQTACSPGLTAFAITQAAKTLSSASIGSTTATISM